MYTCMYICTNTEKERERDTCIYIYMYIHVCIYTYVYTHLYICNVCIYTYMCVCAYIYTYVCIYIHIFTYDHTQTLAHKPTLTCSRKNEADQMQKERLEELASKEGRVDLYDYCHKLGRSAMEVLRDFPSARYMCRLPLLPAPSCLLSVPRVCRTRWQGCVMVLPDHCMS